MAPRGAAVHSQRHLLQAVLSCFLHSESEHSGPFFGATLSSPDTAKRFSSVQAMRKALHANPESIL